MRQIDEMDDTQIEELRVKGMLAQPGTKDIDAALALEKAHTQRNYYQAQLVIATRERDEALAQNEGKLNLLKSLVYFHDTDDTAAHDYWQDARAIIAIARAEKAQK